MKGSENGHQLAVVASLSQSRGPKAYRIGSRRWHPNRRTERACTLQAPSFPSLGDRGSCTFYQYRLGSGQGSALEHSLGMVSSASVAGTAATGCLGSARKARLFRTAPLPSAAYRVPMPEREQTELERDVAARELANEVDEQPKRRGYIRSGSSGLRRCRLRRTVCPCQNVSRPSLSGTWQLASWPTRSTSSRNAGATSDLALQDCAVAVCGVPCAHART